MTTDPASLPIEHNESAKHFEVRTDAGMAFLEYRLRGDHIVLLHTEVPPQFAGHGTGGKLVRAALEFAKEKGLSVVARCPFAAEYIDRHPEYASLVKHDGVAGPVS